MSLSAVRATLAIAIFRALFRDGDLSVQVTCSELVQRSAITRCSQFLQTLASVTLRPEKEMCFLCRLRSPLLRGSASQDEQVARVGVG